MDKKIKISFRCYYPNGNTTDHKQELTINDIPKWITCYQFTHPECEAITCKVWMKDIKEDESND